MIGEGAFRAQVARARDLLENADVVEWLNPSPAYPVDVVKSARALNVYRDEWQLYVQGSHYDVLLTDGSVIQFKWKPDDNSDLSYCYYESPVAAATYTEFVREQYGVEDSGYQVWDEYEEYRGQSTLKLVVTPVRYDFSPHLYREGVHPASHVHIGYNSEIRIGMDRILSPCGFALLVLRWAYPLQWETKILPNEDAPTLVRELRDSLEAVEACYLQAKDRWELILR